MTDYPSALLSQMKPDDQVVSYLPLKKIKSGCLGTTDIPYGFVAITNQRLIAQGILYQDDTKKSKKQTVMDETVNVPLSKVSSMSVFHKEVPKGGCLGGKFHSYWLRLNVQGGNYEFYVGTDNKTANEFVRSFLEHSE